MSFGGSAVKSLEVVPDPQCRAENGEFRVEGGWGEERKLMGEINLHMKKAVKEAKLSITFTGRIQHATRATGDAAVGVNATMGGYQTETKRICNIEQVIFDAREANEMRTLNTEARIFKYPFTLDLPTASLPPSFEDDKARIRYVLKLKLQWSSMGKQTKEMEVPIQVVMPKEARRKILASQKPITIANNGQKLDDVTILRQARDLDYKYEITLTRRALSPSDTIPVHVRLTDLPQDIRQRISRVKFSLYLRKSYHLPNQNRSVNEAKTMSTATELVGTGGAADMAMEWARGTVVEVPKEVEMSFRTSLLEVKYVLNVSIFSELDAQRAMTSLEVPITIVPAGEPVEIDPNALPTLHRFEVNSSSGGSIKEGFDGPVGSSNGSTFNGLDRQNSVRTAPGEGGVMYRAITSYDGSLPDELRMREGDLITVQETYDDGWGMGKNMSTGNIGFVYLDYLTLVQLPENGRRPPPRAHSERYAPSITGSISQSAPHSPAVAGYSPTVNGMHNSPYANTTIPNGIPTSYAQTGGSPYMSNHYQSSPNLGMQHPQMGGPAQPMHPMHQMDYGAGSPYEAPGQNYFNHPGFTTGPPSPGIITARSHTVMSNGSSAPSPEINGTGGGSSYVCISPFAPTRADQLHLELGDIVIVRKLLGDGWAWGTNAARGYSGLLPMSAVTPARSNTAPAPKPMNYAYGPNGAPVRPGTVASPPLSALPQLPPAFQNHPTEVPADPAMWNDQKGDGHRRNPSTKSIKNNPYGGKVPTHPGQKLSPPPEVTGGATAQLEATMAKLARLASLSGTDGTVPPPSHKPDVPLPTPPTELASPKPISADPTDTDHITATPDEPIRKRDTRPPPYEENHDVVPSSSAPLPKSPPPTATPSPARRGGSLGGANAKEALTAPPTLPRTASAQNKAPVMGLGGVMMYRVIYDFTPTLPDELEAVKGDIILLTEKYEDDWALGKNLSRQKEGVFPLALTEQVTA
ncbi:hypothetical protein HDV00_002434 [Rhizophlyctis rosea]|nr:hypothetical protein HDV00_002434 [Rhizophlyctis rosea]